MNRDYKADVYPVLKRSPFIELNRNDALEIYNFVKAFQKAKSSEHLHRIDDDKELKRYMNGFAAEYALERFLGVKFMDRTLCDSAKYNEADLRSIGINIGVKCSNINNYPTVFKSPHNAEIITVLNGTKVYICGVASIKTMLDYSDENLILNDKFRARGVKTGFFGFDQLVPFKNIEELRAIANNQPKMVRNTKMRY